MVKFLLTTGGVSKATRYTVLYVISKAWYSVFDNLLDKGSKPEYEEEITL